MHFPITQGIIIQRQVGAVRAVDGVSFAHRGRDARTGGREWIRQIDHRALSGASLSANQRHICYLGDDDLVTAKAASCATHSAARADDLPGSVRLARSALPLARSSPNRW